MDTQMREIYKMPLFWAICVTALVVLLFVIVLIANPIRLAPEPADTTATTQPTETATEATLPPPPANPYSLFDFAPDGDYVTCTAGPCTLGIDVSEWQPEVDWQAVKEAGVEFVIIRVGYRGMEQGILSSDSCAQSHYNGAKAAGLKVGCYFFSQAISVTEALEEAEFALSLTDGWELDLPMVYDWEYVNDTARTANVSQRTLTDATKVFCERIRIAGRTPMVYFNTNQSFQRLFLSELTEYDFWLAQYQSAMNYPYKVDMWQFSCSGSVPGIEGDVDLNLWFTYD